MREIKFRAWNGKEMLYEIPTWDDYSELNSYFTAENIENYKYMQYTGLKDKNGKEIYEGDIVSLDHWRSQDLFDYNHPFEVRWEHGQINFKQNGYNNFIGSLNGKLDIEVVGNIYENKELLEVEDE